MAMTIVEDHAVQSLSLQNDCRKRGLHPKSHTAEIAEADPNLAPSTKGGPGLTVLAHPPFLLIESSSIPTL
jgi:hypothetical protein